jgi:hypothetical protein
MFPVYRMAKASVGWIFHFVKELPVLVLGLAYQAKARILCLDSL